MTRALLTSLLALSLLALAPAARAAETIGQTGPVVDCAQDNAYTQSQLTAGPNYSPSAYGVITSWSAMATATAGRTLKLLVLRPTLGPSPTQFTAVQKDEARTLALASQLNTFTGIRLPINPGERLGVYAPGGQPGGGAPCAFASGVTADVVTSNDPPTEPALGVSESYSSSSITLRLNASAVVEPDADRDGFGDETQDACPTDASEQGDCAAPETQITKGPTDKTKKKQATFEFSSNEPGSSFECSLDGGAFAPCTSPATEQVKKGKHSFAVRARDAAGNLDGSPASDDWTVKRKKKKR